MWFRKKNLRRVWSILTNSFNSLLVPLFNVIISAVVIRRYSASLWGEFIQVLIVVQFAVSIVAWGNKEYLLREFSRNPGQISRHWQSSLATRLLIATAVVIFFILTVYPRNLGALFIFWGLGQLLYQSMDVIIVYRKDFPFAALIEVLSFSGMLLTITLFSEGFSLKALVTLYAAVTITKALVLFIRYRRYTLSLPKKNLRLTGLIDVHYLRLAFPFFLLSFSGMLNSRIDLYTVRFFLSAEELARYQVLINMLLYIQALAAVILTPFLKNIYRMKHKSVHRISANLFRFGIFITVPGLLAISLILTQWYGFSFSYPYYILGFLFVVPIYYYLPIIYTLFRIERQGLVLGVNFLGIAINLLMNILLIPAIGLIGALVSTTMVRFMALIIYRVQKKRILSDEFLALSSVG
jgi:O-antigen/teichoic acid export membrane protein